MRSTRSPGSCSGCATTWNARPSASRCRWCGIGTSRRGQRRGKGRPMFAENRQTKLLTLFAMCFALFMAMLDNTVVNVALPRIQDSLGAGVSGLQWVVDAYTLLFASLLLTGGTLGDLYGRKRLFMSGLIIFSIGSLLCGLSNSIQFLIAALALHRCCA